jgi:hypothetical protein
MVFGIVGCAVNPPLLVDYRDPNTKYGDWYYSKYTDEFNGTYLNSVVQSTDNIGVLRVSTNIDDRFDYITYENGDSYICAMYSNLRVQTIFRNRKGREFQGSYLFSRRDGGDSLILRNIKGGEDSFVVQLNKYDELIIRTNDSCGTVTTKTFDIKGTTHLRPETK